MFLPTTESTAFARCLCGVIKLSFRRLISSIMQELTSMLLDDVLSDFSHSSLLERVTYLFGVVIISFRFPFLEDLHERFSLSLCSCSYLMEPSVAWGVKIYF